MEVLGHSQITLTLNTYSHVFPSLKRDDADRMDELFPARREEDPVRVAPMVAPNEDSEGHAIASEAGLSNSESSTRYRTRTCDQGIKSPLLYQLS